MTGHVKILGTLHIVFGALGVLWKTRLSLADLVN